jgi:hypothetical protein
MGFFYTEEQVVEAARRAYREHDAMSRSLLAIERQQCEVPLHLWTDADTELDQIGEELKDALAQIKPLKPVLALVR